MIGPLVVDIGMAWGTDAGYATNPARGTSGRASFLTDYDGAFRDQTRVSVLPDPDRRTGGGQPSPGGTAS